MTFEFENLGPIKKASLELGKLTVICGKNNTGKTYLSYALKHILDNYNDELSIHFEPQDLISQNKALKENGNFELDLSIIEKEINHNLIMLNEDNELKDALGNTFNSSENHFNQTKIKILNLPKVVFHNDAIKEHIEDIILFDREENSNIFKVISLKEDKQIGNISDFLDEIFTSQYTQNYFFIVAERIGLNDFAKDKSRYQSIIYSSRNALSKIYNDTLSKELKSQTKTLRKDIKQVSENMNDYESLYSEPISDNIEFIDNLHLGIWRDENSFISKNHPKFLEFIEDFLGVKYQFIDEQLMIIDKKNSQAIPIGATSSSVKSLSMLYFWLKHQAQEGDLLMIDEPELSLHPENQIKLARLLVKLVNIGVKVWITTHSDYIVKELNNCLMLAKEFPDKEEVMKNLGYEESDILKEEDLRAYIAKYDETLGGGTIERIATDELGMVKSTFDEAMVQINNSADTLATHISEHYNL